MGKALEINKTTRRSDLTESPFIRHLPVGINNDGYWNTNHMAIQLEDVADCVEVLYPGYNYVILFNHSSDHDRKRDSALDATTMHDMRESNIKAVDGSIEKLTSSRTESSLQTRKNDS
jgi:hypothetical protein